GRSTERWPAGTGGACAAARPAAPAPGLPALRRWVRCSGLLTRGCSRVPPCPSHTPLALGGSLVTLVGPDVHKVVVLRPRECSRRPSASVITNHVGPFAGWSVPDRAEPLGGACSATPTTFADVAG